MKSRRQHERVFVGVSVRLLSRADSREFEGSLLNISESGLLVSFFYTAREIPLEESVTFECSLPTGMVTGEAEVVWRDEESGNIGLKIKGIDSEEGIARLLGFISAPIGGLGGG